MGGNAPLVQGAAPAATGNVNMQGGMIACLQVLAGNRKISPISLLRHFRPLESRPGGGCRMDARLVADGQRQRRTRNLEHDPEKWIPVFG